MLEDIFGYLLIVAGTFIVLNAFDGILLPASRKVQASIGISMFIGFLCILLGIGLVMR